MSKKKMTVGELIEELSKYDKSLEVVTWGCCGGCNSAPVVKKERELEYDDEGNQVDGAEYISISLS